MSDDTLSEGTRVKNLPIKSTLMLPIGRVLCNHNLLSVSVGSYQYFGLLQEFKYFDKGLTNRWVFPCKLSLCLFYEIGK